MLLVYNYREEQYYYIDKKYNIYPNVQKNVF